MSLSLASCPHQPCALFEFLMEPHVCIALSRFIFALSRFIFCPSAFPNLSLCVLMRCVQCMLRWLSLVEEPSWHFSSRSSCHQVHLLLLCFARSLTSCPHALRAMHAQMSSPVKEPSWHFSSQSSFHQVCLLLLCFATSLTLCPHALHAMHAWTSSPPPVEEPT